jgi:hypothetical protein
MIDPGELIRRHGAPGPKSKSVSYLALWDRSMCVDTFRTMKLLTVAELTGDLSLSNEGIG